MTWYPIETAPQDGTHIIIGGKQVAPAEGKYRTKTGCITAYEKRCGAGWTRTAFPDVGLFPTHWQPLPAPPA